MLNGAFAELGDEESVRVIFVREDFKHTVAYDRACREGAEGKFGVVGKEAFDDPLVFSGVDGAGRINERASRFQIRGIGFQNLCLQNGQADDVFLRFVADIGLFGDNAETRARNIAKDLVKNGHFGIMNGGVLYAGFNDPSYTVGGNANSYSHYGEQCGDSLKNWK